MANITDAELATIANALSTVRENIDNQDPVAQQVLELIVNAEQIVSAKQNEGQDQGTPGTGGGIDNVNQSLQGGAMPDMQQGGEMSMEEFKAMRETMSQMEKQMESMIAMMDKSMGGQIGGASFPWSECQDKMASQGYSQELADETCGAIKAGTVSH